MSALRCSELRAVLLKSFFYDSVAFSPVVSFPEQRYVLEMQHRSISVHSALHIGFHLCLNAKLHNEMYLL